MAKGVHRSFQGRNGMMFVFDVAFENNDRGQANSTKQTPTWVIGKEYNYEIEEKKFDWGTVWQIKGMKAADYDASKSGGAPAKKGGGGYTKMTPEKQKQIMCQVSYIATNTIMNRMQDDYDTIVREFLSYLILNGEKHDPISLQGALKIAAEYYANVDPNDDEILLKAEGVVTINMVLDKTQQIIINTEKSSKWNGSLNPSANTESSSQESTNNQNQESGHPSEPVVSKPKEEPTPTAGANPPEEENPTPFMKIV